jgi:hypothetical protein
MAKSAARARWLAVALVAGPLLAEALAQRNQPIYPAYDGFLKNPDGSFTLAFAYFSHNAETVTIPSGASNSFSPAPADRQQPTTFRPGHWRFQCVMVVGPEFDGKMVWTLAYSGTTTGTSQRMMQSNWNLVEGAEELSKIDYANAPRGICLNRPPTVRLLGAGRGRGGARITAAAAEEVSLFGSVVDEGLPRSGTLTASWKFVSGPGTVKFENPATARTHATFSTPGSYELELSASDGEFTSTTRVNVDVAASGR